MTWQTVIGLETHAQLSTTAKMFSGAATAFGAAPNTQACAVDLALPGVLPVPNRGAIERAIKFGLAVNATINQRSIFARKNYFYPDLPKGYQISQYEIPIVQGGALVIPLNDREKTIRLTRAHLEEDAGKSLHEDFHGCSGIDLNRAGTPLLEIVSEPDLASAAEAVAYAKTLHALVRWLGICDGNMQEGSFRCDANVSVRRVGQSKLGTRCEIKNLNSFRFLEKAIEFEVARQIDILESGGAIVQETRLYDAEKNETRSMRSKEDAQDYRYFPDPDLPPLVIDEAWIAQLRSELPELPTVMKARFIAAYGLSNYDAALLTTDRETASYYEELVKQVGDAKLCANWLIGELFAAVNRAGLSLVDSPLAVAEFAALLKRVQDGTLSAKLGKELFQELWNNPLGESLSGMAWVDRLIERKGLRQISDSAVIEKIIQDVLAAHPQQVADFRAGKEKAFNSLVGQVMKLSRGQANPVQVNELLKDRLKK